MAPLVRSRRLDGAPCAALIVVPGNRVRLLENGAAYFPALLAAIDAATHEVHLESYLFVADRVGYAVAHALSNAARRGVQVRVVLDGFGAHGLDADIRHHWQIAGVDLLVYHPLRLGWPRLRRMHRKIVVIDAETAFVGGINIIDDHNAPGHPDHRYDYAVQVAGPVLADIHAATQRLWRYLCWRHLRHARMAPRPTTPTAPGTQRAQCVLRDNLHHRRDIEDSYLAAIRHARHEIVIANAYFLPRLTMRRALIEAARRGVRVILLLQGHPDFWIIHYASRAYYPEFLAHGIEIREYHASFMHAKVAVIDNTWATVGSSNLDPFSLWLSREANVVVLDATFSKALRASLEVAMTRGSHAIELATWQRLSRVSRLWSWLAYAVVRVFSGVVRPHDAEH
jgi:cardiolipin synthase A/B